VPSIAPDPRDHRTERDPLVQEDQLRRRQRASSSGETEQAHTDADNDERALAVLPKSTSSTLIVTTAHAGEKASHGVTHRARVDRPVGQSVVGIIQRDIG
jgi:hypothetical protein